MRVIGIDKNGNEIAEVSVTELDAMFKEIRAKAIDEFADSIKTELDRFGVVNLDTCVLYDYIDRTAERLKAGGENEID